MPLTDLLTTVSSRTYPRWGQRSVSPERMDNDDTQSTCADCTTTDLTVELPPVEATVCAVNKEKTTKKARRKANKDQADAVWKVCVPNCFHNGNNNKGNVVQCHLCQTWIHPECVGQNDSDIVGIWTRPTCRTLPVLVQQLLDRSSALESMLVRLEESNRRLVALVGEQRKEMSELRDGIKSANACSYADVVRAPRGVTLLVGNSLVRDIDVMLTADGAETNVCCKSGASFAEIGDMIDEAANHDKLNGIVVVGGTKEAMGNVSIDELKERTQLLITKAKSVAEAVTVGSVLPWRDHDPKRLAKVNGAIRETCCEMCVKYVDHDGNFTFRDGTVDEAAYVSDGLHLSRGGVDRMLANFALPKRKARKTERQPNTRRDSRRVTPRAAARETTDGDARDWRADREPHSSTRRDTRRVTPWAAMSENTDDDPRDWRADKPQANTRHVTRSDTPWAATSENTDDDASNWFVVNRRSSARHTMGQCAKCGETNHVTALCRHRDKVQCRVCGKRGHTEKHHTEQNYH